MSKFRLELQASGEVRLIYGEGMSRRIMDFEPRDLSDLASCAQAALAEHNSGVMGERPCPYCDGEKRIETDNNGPIVDCPVCNGSGHSTHNTKDQDTRMSE